ncbi:MAG: hypothetical protein HY344_03000 [Candidatus Levybacteria bacterium]|nr:hypothetical protein [Candidatus Levybacteria bacterium]
MRAVQKILFVFIFVIIFLFFKTPVFAQGVVSANNYQTRDLNIWSQNVVVEVMSAFSCQLAGVNFSHKDQKCLGFDPKTGQVGFVDNGGGVLGIVTRGIAMLYTSPASTGQYVSYLSQSFGISRPSYAQSQGIGFESISPIVGIWAVFRDISYLLFIFVFIIIGVAIMLRAKIDPRTVMTIQNQIPKLIIGIIMVTLSFAIAGVLIDLMWVSTYVVIRVMNTASNNINITKTQQNLNNHAIGFFDQAVSYGDQNEGQGAGGLFNLAQKGAGSLQETINSSFGQASPPNEEQVPDTCNTNSPVDILCHAIGLGRDVVFNLGDAASKFVSLNWGELAADAVGGVLSGILGFLVSWLIGGLAFFVILILLLWNLFKLWITLLKCYLAILIDIIFAPFWILGGLIPGASNLGFTGWIKDLLGNLAVFPATVGLFLLAKLFVDISDKARLENQGFFVPPLIGNFAGGIYTLGPLIALGFVLGAPHVAEGVKKSFKEKFSIDLSGVGESLKTGQGMGMAFLGTVRGRFYKQYVTQAGEKYERGLLAESTKDIRRAMAQGFWGSSLGRVQTLRKVALKLSEKGPDQKTPGPRERLDRLFKEVDAKRAGVKETTPATPPPGRQLRNWTSEAPPQEGGGETQATGGGETRPSTTTQAAGGAGGGSPMQAERNKQEIIAEVRKQGVEKARQSARFIPPKRGK